VYTETEDVLWKVVTSCERKRRGLNKFLQLLSLPTIGKIREAINGTQGSEPLGIDGHDLVKALLTMGMVRNDLPDTPSSKKIVEALGMRNALWLDVIFKQRDKVLPLL